MGKMQKVLLVLIICVTIMIIVILAIFMNRREQGIGYENVYIPVESVKPEEQISVLKVRNFYYAVSDAVNKFYTYNAIVFNLEEYYSEVENIDLNEARNENAQIIYNMLDSEYIEAKGITKENIVSKLNEMGTSLVDIDSIYVSEKSNNISIYIVSGSLIDRKTKEISKFKMIIKFDIANETFSIIPNDYVNEKYGNLELGGQIDITVPENIEVNKNNLYTFRIVSDDTYASDLFNKYKEELMYNQNAIYNSLEENYKNAKFANLAEFKDYMNNRYTDFSSINVSGYQKKDYIEYTQYVLLDKDGNYYIFRENAPMDYSLILDTYTVDIPEFTDKYNIASNQEKVVLNLNKINTALNYKDYKYIYGVLADSFKKSNFANYETFVKYMSSNFNNRNEFDYMEFDDSAGTYYTYRVKIIDGTDNIKEKTFIMLLGDGTNYQISFNLT